MTLRSNFEKKCLFSTKENDEGKVSPRKPEYEPKNDGNK